MVFSCVQGKNKVTLMVNIKHNFSLYRVLAEEELQINIAEKDVFTLPSGQEIEKEYILFAHCFAPKKCAK